MEKLLNSLRKHCLSIFTVSRWMDNPQSQRGGGRAGCKGPVLSGPLLYLLRARPSQNPEPGFLLGSRPLPPSERGLLRRQSHGTARSEKLKLKVTVAAPPGTVSCVCSRQPSSGGEKLGCPGKAEVPLPFHFRRPHRLRPLCRAGPRFLRRQCSKIERQSQPAVVYKKGAMDSGISETNLTLVFRLFQTIKIKAGLRRLLSSESCYVFLIWQG